MKLLVFLTIIASLCSVRAQEELTREGFPDGSSITLTAPFSVLPAGGFASVRVEVDNKSGKEVSWNLKANSTAENYSYYRSRDLGKISSNFSVSCPAGTSRQVDLLIPVQQANENGVYERSLRITAESKSYPNAGIFASLDRSGGLSAPCLSVSRGLLPAVGSTLEGAMAGRSRMRGNQGRLGNFTIEKLPQDWRAYAGLDALLLSVEESKRISPGVSLALQQWIQSGGRMLILNPGDEGTPDSVERLGLGSREVINVGSGYSGVTLARLGFQESVSDQNQTLTAGRGYANRSWSLGQELGSRSMHSSLLILALIVFAILVGPINLFVWANRTRRHRLFVTTPVISIGASLILVVIIILQDGFGGDGARAIAIDVGAPDSTSASIVQEQFSRTGILLSSGFTLDDNSMMVPVSPPTTDYNRADSKSYTGDFSYSAETTDEGWKISGEWFSSRSEQAQVIRSVIPSRERLELIGSTGGAPRLSSTFAYPLKDVYYCDSGGEIWTATAIDPGETVTLEASYASDRDDALEPLVSRFGEDRQKNLQRTIRRKNSFAASSTQSSTIPTLASIDWQESPALITGLLSK